MDIEKREVELRVNRFQRWEGVKQLNPDQEYSSHGTIIATIETMGLPSHRVHRTDAPSLISIKQQNIPGRSLPEWDKISIVYLWRF